LQLEKQIAQFKREKGSLEQNVEVKSMQQKLRESVVSKRPSLRKQNKNSPLQEPPQSLERIRGENIKNHKLKIRQ
jgi:hypothetical protein